MLLAEILGWPIATKGDYPIAPLLIDSVSARFLKSEQIIPLFEQKDSIAVAFGDPLNAFALASTELAIDCVVDPWIGIPAEIEAALSELYGSNQDDAALTAGYDDRDDQDEDLERLVDLASEAPVIRLVNTIIARAVDARASDIHLESFRGRLAIRYRIDGDLVEVDAPPSQTRAAIISRIKIMARLNIAERRKPQDGRIRIAVRGTSVDLRVSTLPMMHGESIVLRVLDQSGLGRKLTNLGFGGTYLDRYRKALAAPNGIVLITGPTGSGKTSTLYASMLEIASPKRNIVTVEDPIEYELPGINQIQTNESVGLTFSHILRSVLRHDPDIIMIGEIRDRETAEIAVQSALTGHLVLSTLHTNSAAAAIGRLLDMKVEGYLLTSTLEAVVAQRLVRRLCPHCRESYEPSPELAGKLEIVSELEEVGGLLWKPRGCDKCENRGYMGRTAVVEVMQMNETLQQLVLRDTTVSDLHKAACDSGMCSLIETVS